MPALKVNGVNLFYKESGSGPETIVFSHGLLMDHSMFEPQRAVFEKQYRVIAYDHRAQGQSEDIGRGYDMSTIADDAALLIRALKAAPCHFAGLSMGGFAGMRVAAHHPELIRTLTLMNTTATKEKLPNRIKYAFLAQMVKIIQPRAVYAYRGERTVRPEHARKSAERRAMLEAMDRQAAGASTNIAPFTAGGDEPARVPGGGDGRNPVPHADHYRRGRYGPAAAQFNKLDLRASAALAM